MATQMLQRRGTAAEWAAANPILDPGEIGFETDTFVIKLGDGVTPWNSLGLPYLPTAGGTLTGALTVQAPTEDDHAARRIDVDNAKTYADGTARSQIWDLFRTWKANTRTMSASEADYIAHTGTVTINDPGESVVVMAMQNVRLGKGPAVGLIEVWAIIEISFDGGSTWEEGDVSVDIVPSTQDRGGGMVALHTRTGTPTGDIVCRLASRHYTAESGTVSTYSSGGFVLVKPSAA